jgi:Protein of unknown function (DUF1552)
MMVTGKALPRRTLLRGMGSVVGLPFLDAMVPAFSLAQARQAPVRMAFVYVPNGVIMDHWNPAYKGRLGELPRLLKPMEPFKDDILVLGNLTHNNGRALLDGGGDHARATGGYLTGMQPRKTTLDIKTGISCDQVVAQQIGGQTRFPSLELGIEDAQQAGNCDSGYSCSYTNNLAWKNDHQPLPPILDPRALFERLFGDDADMTPEARERRNLYRRSILDSAGEDSKRLESRVGPSDRRKLDEYLTSVREVETRLQKNEKNSAQIDPHMEKPYGIPAEFSEHFKLMTDMMTIAFQADLTRVATFLAVREGSNRAYREIGISDGHHSLTHHRNDPLMIEKVAKINHYHVQQFAAWIEKMKSIQDGDATLLDNSMIVYGSGISDGNRHTHEDLPTVIAGRGGDFLKPGRRVVYRRETPICNLYLTMMDRMGVRREHFGDSTEHLEGLNVG